MPTALERILDDTRATLPALRARRGELDRAARGSTTRPSFSAALRRPALALIAEVKRRSPSAGAIAPTLDPVAHAQAYAAAGAAAISVLTDGPHFGGSLDDLRQVCDRVALPVLRKDFILDPTQIAEARAAGASAVLLIVRALAPAQLLELGACARSYGLESLVEVHDEAELDVALASGAELIGVNSRNLDTFAIDTEQAWRLLGRIPGERVAIAESGMATVAAAEHAASQGADAVLIGTALSSALNPASLVAAIAALPRRGRQR